MKIIKVIAIGILFTTLLLPSPASKVQQELKLGEERSQSLFQAETGPLAVVVLDDLHDNDYADGDFDNVVEDLEENGFIAKFASEFESWNDAVDAADILVMSASYGEITSSDNAVVKEWFDTGSRNLLLASRGDFESVNFKGMNDLLSNLGSSMKVQDDNVYTSNQAARQPWYVETTNFNDVDFADIFDNVNVLNFFSPSSLADTENGNALIYAEKEAYQTNQNGDPANVIYDNVDDSTGGDSIPLSLYEEVVVGNETDRIITIGTTMWSDFDYGDPNNDDPILFMNMMNYFVDKTLEIEDITIDVPDEDAPSIKITYPHNNAVLSGTVNISVVAFDLYGISNYTIIIGDTEVANRSFYVWDTTEEEDGPIQVTATASDPNGNKASVVFDYTIDQEYEPSLDDNAKFMTYNIKQSGAFSEWMDVMKEENADVAILVETGDFDNNNDKLLKSVTEELNTYFFDELPYESATMQDIPDDFDGITILSRFPLQSSVALKSLVNDEGTNVGISLPFLHSIILVDDIELHVIGAHLTSGVNSEDKNAREEQQESIINYMDELGDVPIVYMGDMNAESRIDNSQSDLGNEPIEMLVKPDHEHASEIHTFTDVYQQLNPDDYKISYLTFPGRIDFIFVNQWMNNLISDSTIGDTFSALRGSDHLSVDVFINLENLGNYTPETGERGAFLSFEIAGIMTGTILVLVLLKKQNRL